MACPVCSWLSIFYIANTHDIGILKQSIYSLVEEGIHGCCKGVVSRANKKQRLIEDCFGHSSPEGRMA